MRFTFKSLIIFSGLGLALGCLATENKPSIPAPAMSKKITPPPPIANPLSAPASNLPPAPEPAGSSSGSIIASLPATQSQAISSPANTLIPAQEVSSSAPIMPSLGTSITNNLPTENSTSVSPVHEIHDVDASTGIHGAHVVSGVNFEEGNKEDETLTLQGVDTTHVKQVSGNWLEKKHYLHQIEEIVDEAKEKIAALMTQRATFFTTRNEADKELMNFYQHVGWDQGPLQDMIHYALEIMEKEKEYQGFLNKRERAFYEKAQAKQRIFEQLKEDVKAIGVIDTKIDEALDVVLKQINACTEYEGEVWNIYKTVAYELSEKEAEQHYLIAKAFLQDIENIETYLSGTFQSYFQELTSSLQTHTQNIVMQLDGLEKEGVNLKQEAAIFEAQEEVQIQQDKFHKEELKKMHDASHADHSSETKVHEHAVATQEKKSSDGFFDNLKKSVQRLWVSVKGLFSFKSSVPTVKKQHPVEHQEAHKMNTGESLPLGSSQHVQPEVQNKLAEPAAAVEPVKQEINPAIVSEKVSLNDSRSISPSAQEFQQELQQDAQGFDQEMEELKNALKKDAQEIMSAPVHAFEDIEKKL